MSNVLDLQKITDLLNDFAHARDWEKFHSAKNLAMALTVEASELLEIFQWLTEKESDEIKNNPELKTTVEHELADILLYTIRLAERLHIHLPTAIETKMEINQRKYPAEKVKGSAKKYSTYT